MIWSTSNQRLLITYSKKQKIIILIKCIKNKKMKILNLALNYHRTKQIVR